jgi:hypothetical protein
VEDAMTDHPDSMIELVKHGARETATHLLTAANLAVYRAPGADDLTLELFDEPGRKSYRLHLCAEDVVRLKTELRIVS